MHTRTEWGARPPKRTPTPLRPGVARGIIWHWNGPPINWSRDPAEVVRSTQDFHLNHPTFDFLDIAYNLSGDWMGGVWEGRGLYVANGASAWDKAWGLGNPSTEWIAAELMVGEGQDIVDGLIASAREITRLVRQAHPTALLHRPHNAVSFTRCPDPTISAMCQLGVFDPPEGDDVGLTKDDVKDLLTDLDRRERAVPITDRPGWWVLLPSGKVIPEEPVLQHLVNLGAAVKLPRNGVDKAYVARLNEAA